MTTADLVNRIIEKLRYGGVKFDDVRYRMVAFTYGFHQYRCIADNCAIRVNRMHNGEAISDNYQRWMEGVLNDMVRNDAGELVKPGVAPEKQYYRAEHAFHDGTVFVQRDGSRMVCHPQGRESTWLPEFQEAVDEGKWIEITGEEAFAMLTQ